jgi:glycosyltransferase involved in cell wall biosynthesis
MSAATNEVVILIPMFNDWEAVELLLADLEPALKHFEKAPAVLLIDDGSTDPMPQGFAHPTFTNIATVDVLQLRRNLGHQRAIAVGLVYVYQHLPGRTVIVMDADGEDRPADIVALAEKFEQEGGRTIVFAARSKRLERFLFRALYRVYQIVHLILTGDPVRVGNFSIVPFESLDKLTVIPEIWHHYAAAVIRSRLRFTSIPIPRGKRTAGNSKMNFVALLLHGLSAFFVYGDIVGARLLVGIAVGLLIELIIVAIRFNSLSAYVAAILAIILLQAIPIALILVFTVIGSRMNLGFMPIRDCPYFVGDVRRVFPSS